MFEYLHKGDVALGAGAATLPWWVQVFDQISHVYIVTGAMALVTVRVALAVRDWFRKK